MDVRAFTQLHSLSSDMIQSQYGTQLHSSGSPLDLNNKSAPQQCPQKSYRRCVAGLLFLSLQNPAISLHPLIAIRLCRPLKKQPAPRIKQKHMQDFLMCLIK